MLRRAIAGVFVTLLCSTSATGGLPPQFPSPAIVPQACAAAWDESLLTSLVKPDEPGLAVYVHCAPQTSFLRTFGLRDPLRSRTSIDSATNFRLASLTKQFTAMAVMLLVHDGKLRYEQTLTSIWPDFPAYGKSITIRHLLQHTSGLPDYEDLMDTAESAKGQLWSPERQIQDREVLTLLKTADRGKFAPGSSWAYSNSGYVLLGLIVAKVSGIPYSNFLRTRIFAALGMDNTVAYVKGTNEVTNRAYGHTKVDDAFYETDQSSTSATLGDGGIYSNLIDLAKWDDAVRNYSLLAQDEMKVALTPAVLRDGSQTLWPAAPSDDNLDPGRPVSYGFGWFLDPYRHHGLHPRMWHYGSTVGFRSRIERYTEQQVTVIVLCNRTDLDPAKLAQKIADSYLAER